jgi:serine protease AprX
MSLRTRLVALACTAGIVAATGATSATALSAAQVRQAMHATASPVLGADEKALPFWQVGYGHINLDKAVRLVRGADWKQNLTAAAKRADARVLKTDGLTVVKGDFWQQAALPVTVGGVDSATYTTKVAAGVQTLSVTLVHPGLGSVCCNGLSYTVTVKDPSGAVTGTSTESITSGHGTAYVLVNVKKAGTYTFEISGDYGASDPDTIDSDSILGRVVLLHVAQLRKS